MKSFKFLLTLLIAFAAAFVLYGCSASDCDNASIGSGGLAIPKTGTITGTVTDSNGTPIAGAVVSATGIKEFAPATTAADGTYTIPNVPFGTYQVSALYQNTTYPHPNNVVIPQEDVNGTIITTIIADIVIPVDSTPPP